VSSDCPIPVTLNTVRVMTRVVDRVADECVDTPVPLLDKLGVAMDAMLLLDKPDSAPSGHRLHLGETKE
jgi:hypothetical protein